MGKLRNLRNSLFLGYIAFYAALVFLTALLLGALLSGIFLRNINHSMQSNAQNRIESACQDLDAQMESMRLLSLKLSVQRLYQKSYFSRSKYREIELLESLSRYQAYSSLASEFALIYPAAGDGPFEVFSSGGAKSDFSVFLARYGLRDSEEIQAFLRTSVPGARSLIVGDGLLLAYTISPGASQEAEGAGVLLFVIQPAVLSQRLDTVGGLTPGGYRLYLQGELLIDGEETGSSLWAESGDGFRIEAFYRDLTMGDLLLSRRDLALFAVILVILVLSILVLAYCCYRPIRAMARRYAGEHGARKNELVALDMTLAQLQSRTQSLSSQADNRAALLRNYMLLMLLNNFMSPSMEDDLFKVGVEFRRPLFFVAVIMPCAGQSVNGQISQTIAGSLSDIGEDVGTIYSVECNPQNRMLAVICDLEQPEDRDVILKRLHSYLNAQPMRFLVGEGPAVASMSGIPSSYLTAVSQLEQIADDSGTYDTQADRREDGGERDALERMTDCVEQGDCQGALLALDSYMAGAKAQSSGLMRQNQLFGVNSAVHRLCERTDFPLSEEQLALLLRTDDVEAAHYGLLKLIPPLCAHVSARSQRAVVPAYQLVTRYLEEHYTDYDVSAKQVSEAVGIGINRVNAIVRKQTGQSCKGYITQLRIKKACRMLTDTQQSIVDIARSVGYNSASYFIKVFREAMDETPEAYRKKAEEV